MLLWFLQFSYLGKLKKKVVLKIKRFFCCVLFLSELSSISPNKPVTMGTTKICMRCFSPRDVTKFLFFNYIQSGTRIFWISATAFCATQTSSVSSIIQAAKLILFFE